MSKDNDARDYNKNGPHLVTTRYLFIDAAYATAIAGIVHLYMPLAQLRMFENIPVVAFFLCSGIAQILWIFPMIRNMENVVLCL